ncbi:hypothetical protein FHS92_001426 [Sphingobium subterraneum]|uniref:Uncharacterized protein n=1 Tax=Sphingobium subterraneum TaxID=627688 RepID=A0A841IYM1_9SPHN|nr:hypothetical protein [Sphingobium subterraneum]
MTRLTSTKKHVAQAEPVRKETGRSMRHEPTTAHSGTAYA